MRRRAFLKTAGGLTVGSILSPRGVLGHRVSSNDKVALAVMGVRGRGKSLTELFASMADVDIPYLCDVDRTVVGPALKVVEEAKGKRPKLVEDIRSVLDDQNVDAVVVATPIHWHASATIQACEAGKDVYVEKPCSHNVREGRLMVEAARRNQRIVQVGTQARSRPATIRFVEYVRSGKIGQILMAKALNTEFRSNIGHKSDEPVPPGLNYDLWTGPVPMLPFNRNHFHSTYNWHWHYGAGELGNNGAHWLDICRWILDVDYPREVNGFGRTLRFEDDKQTPDTEYITYDFPDKLIVWEHRMWTPYGYNGSENTVIVYGTEGRAEMGRWVDGLYAFRAYDAKGRLVHYEQEKTPDEGNLLHARNFIECIRNRALPQADIETGHISAVLCHLGNTVTRTGRNIQFDAKTETIPGDPEPNRYLTREYRKHWSSEPFVKA